MTEESFNQHLAQIIATHRDAPDALLAAYREFYEKPVLEFDGSLEQGLARVPGRHRPLIAAHRCGVMLGADGFGKWARSCGRNFDRLAIEGFATLGLAHCEQVLVKARSVLGYPDAADLASEQHQLNLLEEHEDKLGQMLERFYEGSKELKQRLATELVRDFG